MGRLPPPKGKVDEDWEDREQLLFRSTEFGDDSDRPLVNLIFVLLVRADRSGNRARLGARHPARQRRGAGRSPPIRWKRRSPRTLAVSARGDRGRGRTEPRTTRRADRLHPAADARHSAERRDGADGRRNDHHGIIPGPQVMTKNPTLFWGMVVSMWIGNLMLLIINLPLIGLWVRLLKVPYRLMFPAILISAASASIPSTTTRRMCYFTAFFGLVGYILMKFGFEPAPMLLGFVLGKLMEEKLRQALILSRGSFSTFVERPVSAGLLLVAAVLLVVALLPSIQKSRDEVFTE